MIINPAIFKAYDIRGLYEKEIDADVAYRIGRAFADLVKSELTQESITVMVGQDMRVSSPELTTAVIHGIREQGINVVDVGLVSTPSFYVAVAKYGYDAGIMVSASHNPAQYNGFKMTRRNAIPISGETGIMQIRDAVIANTFVHADKPGSLTKRDGVIPDHVAMALTYVDVKKIKPLKVVVDTANGMGGPLFRELFNQLPCSVVFLNEQLDGTFPGHEADPLKDENNKQLHDAVVKEKADIGIVLDGDADRIFFVDNEGHTVAPAIVRGILAHLFLRDNPGATICYDIRPGQITIDMITEAGGKPVVTRVGHSLIKEKARDVDAVFAGESSGHFFMKMPFGIFEEPCTMALKLLVELSETGKSVTEYIKPLQRYSHSGEINFEVKDKQAVMDVLREKYKENLEYDFDGLSFRFDEWWFNVRGSNTENKLRLNLEAKEKSVMEKRVKEVAGLIRG